MLSDYFKYLDTSDALHLTDYYKVKRPKKPTAAQLEAWELEFQGDILRLTQNYDVIRQMQKRHKMMKLTLKYQSVMILINQISISHDTDLVPELEAWGYKVDKSKPLSEQLERIANSAQAIRTEVEVLAAELNSDGKKEKVNSEAELARIELALELRYPIDPTITTVAKWIEYRNILTAKLAKIPKDGRN